VEINADYENQLNELISKVNKDIIVQILDILDKSINKTLSGQNATKKEGIEELKIFRQMWNREFDTATFFIASAYEDIFRKRKDITEKIDAATNARDEYKKIIHFEKYEHICSRYDILEKYIEENAK
jgi:effector-binding domain-containing protein